MNFEEHILVGIGIGHGDFDPALRIYDTCANFQKLDPDCPWHSFGQLGSLQSFAADAINQDISITGHDETKLIGAVINQFSQQECTNYLKHAGYGWG